MPEPTVIAEIDFNMFPSYKSKTGVSRICSSTITVYGHRLGNANHEITHLELFGIHREIDDAMWPDDMVDWIRRNV